MKRYFRALCRWLCPGAGEWYETVVPHRWNTSTRVNSFRVAACPERHPSRRVRQRSGPGLQLRRGAAPRDPHQSQEGRGADRLLVRHNWTAQRSPHHTLFGDRSDLLDVFVRHRNVQMRRVASVVFEGTKHAWVFKKTFSFHELYFVLYFANRSVYKETDQDAYFQSAPPFHVGGLHNLVFYLHNGKRLVLITHPPLTEYLLKAKQHQVMNKLTLGHPRGPVSRE